MKTTARFCAILSILLLAVAATSQTKQQRAETISEFTRGMQKSDGYVPVIWDQAKGRLLLEISRFDEDFLYLPSLSTGLGINGVGLDRGRIGDEKIGRFKRVGPKVLFELQNTAFRAGSENEALRRSVEESFTTSVVAAFDILAEENGRALVDATPYFLQDVPGIAARLKRAGQGEFRLDKDRSVIYMPRTKAFPGNTEIEASLTFTSNNPSSELRQHAADGRAITLRTHHSLVRLPDDGYKPRAFDPRIGLFSVRFYDYARTFDQDYMTRYIIRHRLIKRDPDNAMSEPVEPIVYYLDRAVPEPYRSAFKEGAMWWNDVFGAAGFRNAYRVEDMPPGMDPLDARYHVIQWVHRTVAGSSIGPSFVDPRTGEIIKAAVRMDSHRSLADFDIYASAVPAFGQPGTEFCSLVNPGPGSWVAAFDPDVTGEAFVMARRRQHSAHEVGHTLGFAHNFIAASYGRASVMDYPAPLITLDGDRLALRDAYREGPGAYDSIAVRYAYTQFSEGQATSGLQAIVKEAIERDLKFITNPDAGSSSAYAEASTWINGSDPLDELTRVMRVRKFLLDRFDENAIAAGEPMYKLNRRLARVYFHHHFTLLAAIKIVGGMEFRYAVRGDGTQPTQIASPERQRQGLNLLLDALQVENLSIPERVLALMAPRPFGYLQDVHAEASPAGDAFDQLASARKVATTVVRGILHPERAARVAAFADRDAKQPGLEEVLDRMLAKTWRAADPDAHAALKRVTERVVLDELLKLAANASATPEVRAAALWGIRSIEKLASERSSRDPAALSHREMARLDIQRFLNRGFTEEQLGRPERLPRLLPIGN